MDAKALIISYLNAHVDAQVVSRVPSKRPTVFVRVLLAGGAGRLNQVLEERAFTVEAWASDEPTAHDLAAHVRSLLSRLDVWDGQPVYRYSEWGPPVDLPDESGQYRYQYTFSIRLRMAA